MIDCIPFKNSDMIDPSVLYNVRFVKAAIRIDSVVYTDWRHYLIIKHLHDLGFKNTQVNDQGFVDQNGFYYKSRSFCAYWAWRNGQIKQKVGELTSEYLWDAQGNSLTN